MTERGNQPLGPSNSGGEHDAGRHRAAKIHTGPRAVKPDVLPIGVRSSYIVGEATFWPRRARLPAMQLTLLESHRSFFQVAECALVSVLAHAGVVWLAVSATTGGTQLPADEREARVFFLLPPDRVDVRSRQMERFEWGLLGQDLENGRLQVGPGESRPFETLARGVRGPRHRAGSRG